MPVYLPRTCPPAGNDWGIVTAESNGSGYHPIHGGASPAIRNQLGAAQFLTLTTDAEEQQNRFRLPEPLIHLASLCYKPRPPLCSEPPTYF